MMSRILNVESFQCGACDRKFNTQGCLELHLRSHSVDDARCQDRYLSTLRLRNALSELRKVTSRSSSNEDSMSKPGTGPERSTGLRWPVLNADLSMYQGETKFHGQQSESKDGDETINISMSAESSMNEERGQGSAKNEGGNTRAVRNANRHSLLQIKHITNKFQKIQSHRCHACDKDFGERSCFELHLRRHLGESQQSQDPYVSALKLRGALLKLGMIQSSRKENSDGEEEANLSETLPFGVGMEDSPYSLSKEGSFDSMSTESNPVSREKSIHWQVCRYCGECFDSEDGLYVHKEEHAGMVMGAYSMNPLRRCQKKDLHECDQCPKKFVSLRTFKKHLYAHRDSFVCHICGKVYEPDKSNLFNDHLKRHNGEFQFTCYVCGKKFLKYRTLQVHMPIHSDRRPFPCKTCGGLFKSRTRLLRHIRVRHSGRVERHLCEICGKNFTRKSTMEDHFRSHTGERPYICSLCGKTFKAYRTLRVHKATHGEPQYECHICQKRITTKFGLRCHVRLHTGEEPFSCEFCDKKFKRKHDLVLHMKKKHD